MGFGERDRLYRGEAVVVLVPVAGDGTRATPPHTVTGPPGARVPPPPETRLRPPTSWLRRRR